MNEQTNKKPKRNVMGDLIRKKIFSAGGIRKMEFGLYFESDM